MPPKVNVLEPGAYLQASKQPRIASPHSSPTIEQPSSSTRSSAPRSPVPHATPRNRGLQMGTNTAGFGTSRFVGGLPVEVAGSLRQPQLSYDPVAGAPAAVSGGRAQPLDLERPDPGPGPASGFKFKAR